MWIVLGIVLISLGIILPFFSDSIFPNKKVCSFYVPLEDLHTSSYKQELACYLEPGKYVAYVDVDVYSRIHTNIRPRPVVPRLYIYLRSNKKTLLDVSVDEDGGKVIVPLNVKEKTKNVVVELRIFANECCMDEYYKELSGKLVTPLFDYRFLFLLIPIGLVLLIIGLAKYLAKVLVISK